MFFSYLYIFSDKSPSGNTFQTTQVHWYKRVSYYGIPCRWGEITCYDSCPNCDPSNSCDWTSCHDDIAFTRYRGFHKNDSKPVFLFQYMNVHASYRLNNSTSRVAVSWNFYCVKIYFLKFILKWQCSGKTFFHQQLRTCSPEHKNIFH